MTRSRAGRPFSLLLAFVLLSVPTAARADAGTPLLWTEMLHLLALNAAIGAFEAWVLARVVRDDRPHAARWIVPANYVSMVVGWIFLHFAWTPMEHLLPGKAPLFQAPWLILLLFAATFLISVFVEWPFIALALPRKLGWRGTLRASLIAQSASYSLLVPLYLLVSPISLFTSASRVPDTTFVRPPIATIYFLNHAGAIERIGADGSGRTLVRDIHLTDPSARLYARPGHEGTCDLWCASQEERNSPPAKRALLLTGIPGRCADSPRKKDDLEPDTWLNFDVAYDFRPNEAREWTVSPGFWDWEGLTVSRGEREMYTLAFDTPFEGWGWRNASILPGNQALLQLGIDDESQIVILDLPQRKVGLLALGHGPTAILAR